MAELAHTHTHRHYCQTGTYGLRPSRLAACSTLRLVFILPNFFLQEDETPQQLSSKTGSRQETLKTPPTPKFGPGWVEQQKQKFEGIALRPIADVHGEEGPRALDTGAEGHLDRLTLLLWQLQSDIEADSRGPDERGETEAPRLVLEEALSEAERLLKERTQAKADAARLSARVESLEKEQRDAAGRIQASCWFLLVLRAGG